MGARSLISQAAGIPVAKVMHPMTRNVHAGPSRDIKPSIAKLMAVPPSPPLAYTMPLASPRFLLKYWAGVTDTTYRHSASTTTVRTWSASYHEAKTKNQRMNSGQPIIKRLSGVGGVDGAIDGAVDRVVDGALPCTNPHDYSRSSEQTSYTLRRE
jgi:hypothetical protein